MSPASNPPHTWDQDIVNWPVGARGWVEGTGWRGLGGRGWVEGAGWRGLGGGDWVEGTGWKGLGGRGWVEGAGWKGLGGRDWVEGTGRTRFVWLVQCVAALCANFMGIRAAYMCVCVCVCVCMCGVCVCACVHVCVRILDRLTEVGEVCLLGSGSQRCCVLVAVLLRSARLLRALPSTAVCAAAVETTFT